jgi:hypothetical protein
VVAQIPDSTEIYRTACVGLWTVQALEGGRDTRITKYTLELFANGAGAYSINENDFGGSIWATTKYGNPTAIPVNWNIEKLTGTDGFFYYRMNITGYFQGEYIYRNDVMKNYPVLTFKNWIIYEWDGSEGIGAGKVEAQLNYEKQ